MNTMNIPGFTAETSLYKTSGRYRSLGQRGEPEGTVVIPQLGGPGYIGKFFCVEDCLEKGHTRKYCEETYCKADTFSFGGRRSGSSSGWWDIFIGAATGFAVAGPVGAIVGGIIAGSGVDSDSTVGGIINDPCISVGPCIRNGIRIPLIPGEFGSQAYFCIGSGFGTRPCFIPGGNLSGKQMV